MKFVSKKIKLNLLERNEGQIEGLPRNPRFIKDKEYEKMVKSLRDDPEMADLKELWVTPHPTKKTKFVIVAGNQRSMAMNELEWTEASCKVIPKYTPAAKLRRYALKDNLHFGQDDWDELANEWEEEELADIGMVIPNFDGSTPKEIVVDEKQSWFLNIEFTNEAECEKWHDKLIQEGLDAKIVT